MKNFPVKKQEKIRKNGKETKKEKKRKEKYKEEIHTEDISHQSTKHMASRSTQKRESGRRTTKLYPGKVIELLGPCSLLFIYL